MKMHDLNWPAMMQNAGFDAERIIMAPAVMQVRTPPTPDNPEGAWKAGGFPLFGMAATVPAS